MVKELISKYRSLTFENKTIFTTKFSIGFNLLLAIGKFILAIVFKNVFFFVAGVLNIFFLVSKLECYLGIKKPLSMPFKKRNFLIGMFLYFAGLQYIIYMGRMLYADVELMSYNMFLGISIACVSFVELAIAIKGCFNSFGKGHYYRNIKLINLCSAFTAIVLTEVALMSFAFEGDSKTIDGIFGVAVGAFILLISIFIFVAPRVSILDREHNVYRSINEVNALQEEIKIQLTFSKYYRNHYYVAKKEGNIIDGHLIQGKSPLHNWNIYIKILVIVLSEILIFPYAVGALVFYFKNGSLIKKLDDKMEKMGYEKIIEKEG